MNYNLTFEEAHLISVPRFSPEIVNLFNAGYTMTTGDDNNVHFRKEAAIFIVEKYNRNGVKNKYRVTTPSRPLTKSDLTFLEVKFNEREISINDLLNGKIRDYKCTKL